MEKITIEHKGKIFSLNDLYGQNQWVRRAKKKEWKPRIFDMFENANLSKMELFGLYIQYNTRHDPDNVVGIEKMFVDCLKEAKYIKDDSKKYFKFLVISPDQSLDNDTVKFNIYNIKEKEWQEQGMSLFQI